MMPNRIGRGTLFVVGMLITGCASKRNETGTISYQRETARLVSHVTSDLIRAGDDIRVRFVSPATSGNQLGERLEKAVFSFAPRIEGTARWADRRTLLFQPNAPLPFRQHYRGTLDLAALFPKRNNLQPLLFAFRVAGREIVSLNADFELIEKDDPRRVVYTGRVVFSEKTPLEQVRQAAPTVRAGAIWRSF